MHADWDDSVARRLVSLGLDAGGRLTDDLVTALAARGALLVDLALRGQVVETHDAVEVSRAPTGFAPADRLVAVEGASLNELLRRGAVDQVDVATELVGRGAWTVRRRLLGRRYVDHRADRARADRQALQVPEDLPRTPADAALVAIAGALGLVTARALPSEAVLAATGPVRWLVEVVVDDVDRALDRGLVMRGGVTWLDGSPG